MTSVEQTKVAGGQDIYLDMTWTKLYCEIEYPDGEIVEGGCKNVGGIDDSDKENLLVWFKCDTLAMIV